MLIAFTLSMPRTNSWDGRWSGERIHHVVIRNFGKTKKTAEKAIKLISGSPYLHSFGDGWVARVSVTEVDAKEARHLRKKSCGFCGYNWMIDSIIEKGEIALSET